MTHQHLQGLLAALKGPPLSVFLAVATSPGLGPSAIAAHTGWGRGATYDALRRLANVGWIERRSRGSWVLTSTGRLALWTLIGTPDVPPMTPFRSRRPSPRSARVPPVVPPSATSNQFPEISPSGTNEGPAAPEISPDDTTTPLPVSPGDTSSTLKTTPEMPADDTTSG